MTSKWVNTHTKSKLKVDVTFMAIFVQNKQDYTLLHILWNNIIVNKSRVVYRLNAEHEPILVQVMLIKAQ